MFSFVLKNLKRLFCQVFRWNDGALYSISEKEDFLVSIFFKV